MIKTRPNRLRSLTLACGCAFTMTLSGQAMAAAYKIPEQSINGTALSAAYVANAHGPDAAYYNPAAMVYNENRSMLEADLLYIHLTSIDFEGAFQDDTKKENFLIPTFHYTSPAVGNARFGLSLVGPAGLTKRWNGALKASTEEFTLRSYEINPTVAYRFNDQLAVAAGVRVIYSDGKVKSTAAASRDLEGDSFDYGYNLALIFKPTDSLALAATYRSRVKLTLEGHADLTVPAAPALNYSGGAEVDVQVPAALNLAAAYTFNEQKTTAELVFERTYWSVYKELDFDYDVAFAAPHPLAVFDTPLTKNWHDSDTYRLGITHRLDNQWTLMAGFAYDETPIPKRTVGYELPDSDAKIYSLGARYRYSDSLSLGGAFLYDDKDELKIDAGDANLSGINGEFEHARAYFLTMGLEYRF